MNRPPKKWWYDTVKKLRKIPRIDNPAKVAGWLWYHQLTPKQRIKKLTKKDLQREILKYYTSRIGRCKDDTAGERKKMKPRKAKKHKISKKQLAALARGRKVLKYLRTGRRIAEPREPIIIKEGFSMDGKKKKGKKRAATSYGFEGKKKRKQSAPRDLHGELKGFDPLGLLTDLSGGLAGAITGSFLGGIVPIKNAYIKASIPIIGGMTILSIPAAAKIRFFSRAGLGALIIGCAAIVKNLLPKIPLLSGANDAEGVAAAIDALPTEEKEILGLMPPTETAGEMPRSETAGEGYEDGDEEYAAAGDFVPEEAPLSPATM